MAIIEPFVPKLVPFDCPPDTRAFLEDQFRRLAPIVNAAIQINEGRTKIGVWAFDGVIGFYGAPPIPKQVGVPVTAQGIHDALVALGLFEG